ncbi:MAG: glucose 1-dehydrogenase [Hyphomonadaceae bacterium]|nr:glucose 1-dehydrogenase [Hyphomonadaceae bacterium]
MSLLKGKIAVITGGARGMGAATSRHFAQQGAHVIIADMAEDDGQALARELGDKAEFRRLNVASEKDWIDLAASLKGRGVNALVNNAGVLTFGPILAVEEAEFDRVIGINVKGALFGMKHIGGLMVEASAGAIVNISSIDGFRGANSLGVYVASKWAVRGMTKAAALEFGPCGVRVNSVHPGGVDTTMGNPFGKQGADRDADYNMVPLQRIGQPEEIAAASAFLCSDSASYITGAELLVDGGWQAGYYHKMLPGAPG